MSEEAVLSIGRGVGRTVDLATEQVKESVTLADCCLVPQIYNARRFNVSMDDYPQLVAIDAHCAGMTEFADAIPETQPDAP